MNKDPVLLNWASISEGFFLKAELNLLSVLFREEHIVLAVYPILILCVPIFISGYVNTWGCVRLAFALRDPASWLLLLHSFSAGEVAQGAHWLSLGVDGVQLWADQSGLTAKRCPHAVCHLVPERLRSSRGAGSGWACSSPCS